ncbi:MAG TPA: hypothetical protein VMO47_15045, partial [Rhodothermales bacterium]|nr:hypothetical protein [Rhodothermales bacterium]
MVKYLAFLTTPLLLAACTAGGQSVDSDSSMNSVAERYVKLILQMGNHDAAYVDAYYGPDEWADEAKSNPMTLTEARAEAEELLSDLGQLAPGADAEELARLRHAYLTRQLQSVTARIDMLEGDKLSFDEEARALYDANPPAYDEAHFQELVDAVSAALPPGDGPLHERYSQFRAAFVIPPERLDTVFSTAIEECKRRTAQYMDLPAGESFTVEYVTDKPWSGYNWYQGNSTSLIQVNTDLPIHIDRAIDLACHEGYPGHHVYNTMLESELARRRGWVEVSVYALFSSQSLIAEGTANYGIEMAFPGEERQAFERDVLFPLAGLDSSRVDEYYRVQDLTAKLNYARNEAARAYLNGRIDADSAAVYLNRYALMDDGRAAQSVRFIDTYRSYVINYNLGKDLVRQYVEREAGETATQDERWAVYAGL